MPRIPRLPSVAAVKGRADEVARAHIVRLPCPYGSSLGLQDGYDSNRAWLDRRARSGTGANASDPIWDHLARRVRFASAPWPYSFHRYGVGRAVERSVIREKVRGDRGEKVGRFQIGGQPAVAYPVESTFRSDRWETTDLKCFGRTKFILSGQRAQVSIIL